MIEQFPKLKGGQVALARAEVTTGIVLDEDFMFAIDNCQKVYSVFSSYEEALAVAQEIADKGSAECTIYNADMEVLKHCTG